jgi:ribonuclease BN (tRNA processing enzyme)
VSTEPILLGTAGAPMPVPGRGGIASALVVDGRAFVIDCGRGSPSAFVNLGLDFTRLEAVLLTHLHADHTGDLAGMLLYPWGARTRQDGPLPPIRVYGPSRPVVPPSGADGFKAVTTIHPELPAPGTSDLVEHILAGYACHLNVMPPDAHMPDAGALKRAIDIPIPESAGTAEVAFTVLDDPDVRVRGVVVTHGPSFQRSRIDSTLSTAPSCFSGDTTANDDLIALAHGANILVHCVAVLDYLECNGFAGAALERMAALHTDVSEVGTIARRAGVTELILTHYLPAEPNAISTEQWTERASRSFTGTTVAGTDGFAQIARPSRRDVVTGNAQLAWLSSDGSEPATARSDASDVYCSRWPFGAIGLGYACSPSSFLWSVPALAENWSTRSAVAPTTSWQHQW